MGPPAAEICDLAVGEDEIPLYSRCSSLAVSDIDDSLKASFMVTASKDERSIRPHPFV
jgi:hypothetical protein